MIRLILLALTFILISVSTLIAYPVSLLIGLISEDAKDDFSLGFVKTALRCLLFSSGAKVTYIGLENLPKNGEAVVYAGNHRSFFDIISTYPHLPGRTGFVAKKEMKTWPVVSWWMRNIHCLFLDRGNVRSGVKTILEGIEYVKSGVSMMIFPEGSRSKKEGCVAMFHAGSLKLATKAGVKVIPVAYSNSSAVWEDHFPWVRRAHMIVEFCAPVDTAGLNDADIKDFANRIHDIVYEKHVENARKLGSLPADFTSGGT